MRRKIIPLLIVVACLCSCRPARRIIEPVESTSEETSSPSARMPLVTLHRFWDKKHKEYVYTYGEGEPADWRRNDAFSSEAVVGSASTAPLPDTVHLYRAFCRDERHYFYLTVPANATDIVRMEAFEMYVWTKPGDGRIPIHACFLPDDKDAFFDTNLNAVKDYAARTLKESGQNRKVIESMFYLYPPQLPSPEQPPSPFHSVQPPRINLTNVTATELERLRRVYVASFSPDGRQLATVQAVNEPNKASSYTIQIWDLATGQKVVKLFQSNDIPDALAFSQDGSRIAALTDFARELRVWNLQAVAEPIVISMPKDEPASGGLLAFSHDGESVLVVGRKINRISLADGTIKPLSGIDVGQGARFACSPTAPVMVVLAKGVEVPLIMDLNTGKTEEISIPPGTTPHEIAFSGDGRTLGITRVNTIELWDTQNWKLRTTLKSGGGASASLMNLSLSKDAKTVVAMSMQGLVRRSQRLNVWTGDDMTHRVFGQGEIEIPELSPDGTLIAAIKPDEGFAILEAATGHAKKIGR